MTILYFILGGTGLYSLISYSFGNWTWLFEILFRVIIEIPGMIIMGILEGIFD